MGYNRKKKIRDGQIYSPCSQFLGKGFNFERKLVPGLNEEQIYVESFFLHRNQTGAIEYLNLFLGRAYSRDINLYFVYDTQCKQWFSSGTEFFNEPICKKVRKKNLKVFKSVCKKILS